jgi:bifunctional non-homologous end joining protein LigD
MPLPPGFVPPCLPIKAPQPPTGGAWLHEIKHDGYRLVA